MHPRPETYGCRCNQGPCGRDSGAVGPGRRGCQRANQPGHPFQPFAFTNGGGPQASTSHTRLVSSSTCGISGDIAGAGNHLHGPTLLLRAAHHSVAGSASSDPDPVSNIHTSLHAAQFPTTDLPPTVHYHKREQCVAGGQICMGQLTPRTTEMLQLPGPKTG